MAERRTVILQYSPEQQVELYLKAMLEEHPPDLALADAVASNGAKIVSPLAQRLVEDDRDLAKLHVFDVFLRMQDLGYYAVASDAKIMELLAQQVVNMKDPQWKEISNDLLDKIRAK